MSWRSRKNWEDMTDADWKAYNKDKEKIMNMNFTLIDWKNVMDTLTPYFSSAHEIGGMLDFNDKSELIAIVTAIGYDTKRNQRASIAVREVPALILFHTHPSFSESLPSEEDMMHNLLDAVIGRYAFNCVLNQKGWCIYQPHSSLIKKVIKDPYILPEIEQILVAKISNLTDTYPPKCQTQIDTYRSVGFLFQYSFNKHSQLCYKEISGDDIGSRDILPMLKPCWLTKKGLPTYDIHCGY